MVQTLKILSENINRNPEKQYVKITNYIKSASASSGRLTEGKSDVIIDTQLKPYGERILESIKIVRLRQKDESFKTRLVKKFETDMETVETAFTEILESLEKSRAKMEEGRVNDPNVVYYGNGMESNSETGKIYIQGTKVWEKETVKPTYKTKKSAPKTLVKEEIRNGLPIETQRWVISIKELVKLSLVGESKVKTLKG